jgi:hypothetical protein
VKSLSQTAALDANGIAALLADFRSSDVERSGAATQQLEIILEDPSTFPIFLQIAQVSQDQGGRYPSDIFVDGHAIKNSLPDSSPAEITPILFTTETDREVQRGISFLICAIASLFVATSNWSDLTTVLLSLLISLHRLVS